MTGKHNRYHIPRSLTPSAALEIPFALREGQEDAVESVLLYNKNRATLPCWQKRKARQRLPVLENTEWRNLEKMSLGDPSLSRLKSSKARALRTSQTRWNMP